jgi:hypothetical protein
MLEYRGEAALRRALTLQPGLEQAISDDADARAVRSFDLIGWR